MSTLFLSLAILSLSFSSGFSSFGRYPGDNWNTEQPPYEDAVVNIGNGEHRKNTFIIEDRMGSDYPRQRSSTFNIGNGNHNQNTFTFHGNSEPEDSQVNVGWKNGGTTFVHRGKNSKEVFNIGYGRDNRNEINVNGKPIQDCGGSCDIKHPRKASAGSNLQGISLSLTFLSLLYLFLF